MGLHAADCHGLRPGGSLCRAGCRICEQLGALRLYRCQRCGRVVLICSRCDCGQLYCARGCAHKARQESLRRAGQRYQQTLHGKRKHAARMQRYRREQKQKVTHQAPPQSEPPVPTSPSGVSPLPEKEDSHVCPQLVPIGPPSLLRPPACAVPVCTHPAASASIPEAARATEHLCHFCGCTRSRLVRRASLCDLRRRLVRRAAHASSSPGSLPRRPP